MLALVDPLIRKLERFGQLSDEEKRYLVQVPSRITEYERGALIVRESNTPTEANLIVEGFAYGFKLLPQGTRQILAFHLPGDFCDLYGFTLQTLDHDIAALSACKVAKVPHAKIKEMTERFPRLTRNLWCDMSADSAIRRQWMVSMGRRDAYKGVAHLLCELHLRLFAMNLSNDNRFELPITQHELGDALGLSTVHINRTLQKLRAEGLIVFNGKFLVLPDPERLLRAAEFDPNYLQLTSGATA